MTEVLVDKIRNNLWSAITAKNYEAGLDLMREFCNGYHSPELIAYFQWCFSKIIEGERPSRALHVVKPKHRPKNPKFEKRDIQIAKKVAALIGSGKSREDAILLVTQKESLKKRAVEQAYDENRLVGGTLARLEAKQPSRGVIQEMVIALMENEMSQQEAVATVADEFSISVTAVKECLSSGSCRSACKNDPVLGVIGVEK